METPGVSETETSVSTASEALRDDVLSGLCGLDFGDFLLVRLSLCLDLGDVTGSLALSRDSELDAELDGKIDVVLDVELDELFAEFDVVAVELDELLTDEDDVDNVDDGDDVGNDVVTGNLPGDLPGDVQVVRLDVLGMLGAFDDESGTDAVVIETDDDDPGSVGISDAE